MCMWGSMVHAQQVDYSLEWLAPNTHTYVVSILTTSEDGAYTDFRLPAWRPGRYYLQNYAASVSHFQAQTVAGTILDWQKVDKDTWRVSHSTGGEKLLIRYRYLANNRDAGSSYLSADEVYFNPINLFMYVPSRLDERVRLNLPLLDSTWKQATALTAGSQFNEFFADSYHEFVDAPTVFSPQMKQLEFESDGTTFYVHFQGKYEVGSEADADIASAVKSICEEQAAVFGGYPFESYHFIYRLLPMNLRHAVEHANSASFALPDRIASSAQSLIKNIQGITAHEFWHAWNVKRIRPSALWPYDYNTEQYTHLHWFTEGVTDYYDQLSLIRAQLVTDEQFLSGLARTIQALENSYASRVVSPADASFNSWLAVSPYRNPDHRISYYTLGARLGMVIDLELRSRTKDEYSLDDVFRYLFTTYYQNDLGVPENGVQLALEQFSEDSWDEFFDQYVFGTAAYDYEAMLKPFGLTLIDTIATHPGLRGLGIIASDNLSQGLYIRQLHPLGDAAAGGIAREDLILEIDGQSVTRAEPDEIINSLRIGKTIMCRVYRDGNFLDIPLTYNQLFVPKGYVIKRSKTKGRPAQRYNQWVATQTQP